MSPDQLREIDRSRFFPLHAVAAGTSLATEGIEALENHGRANRRTPSTVRPPIVAPPTSQLERMARGAAQLSPSRGHVLGVLLAAACQPDAGNAGALRPLWAEEAINRAHATLRLVNALNASDRGETNPLTAGIELALARDLADGLTLLGHGESSTVVPCARVMRHVVANLDALFAAAAGDIDMSIAIEPVALAGYRRRALVLVTHELIANLLLHSFPNRKHGRARISLVRHGARSARLRVADDGVGFSDRMPGPCGVGAGLADLLEGALTYDRTGGWTVAEIVFPMPA